MDLKAVDFHIGGRADPATGQNSWCCILSFQGATRILTGTGTGNTTEAILTAASNGMRTLKQSCAVTLHVASPHLRKVDDRLAAVIRNGWTDGKNRDGSKRPLENEQAWRDFAAARRDRNHRSTWSYTRAVNEFGRVSEPGLMDIAAAEQATALIEMLSSPREPLAVSPAVEPIQAFRPAA